MWEKHLRIFCLFILAVLGLSCCTGLSLAALGRGYSGCGAWASHCGGFSCCCLVAQTPGRVVFSSCSLWVYWLQPRGSRAQAQQWQTGLAAPQPMGSSQIRDRTCVFCIGRWILYHWATREAWEKIFDRMHCPFIPKAFSKILMGKHWRHSHWVRNRAGMTAVTAALQCSVGRVSQH